MFKRLGKTFALVCAILMAPSVFAQTINNLGAGSAISPTDILPCYQGSNPAKGCTALQLQQFGREVLKSNRTYFVATTGNDNNDGLSAGTPFLTVQHAGDVASKLDFNSFTVTVQIADGTYDGRVLVPRMVGLKDTNGFVLKGNVTTPTNVILRNTANFQSVVEADFGALVTVTSFRVTAPNSGYGLNAAEAGVINVSSGMDFGDCSGQFHMFANNGGVINVFANYTISGPAASHWRVAYSGTLYASGVTINANSASIAFSLAFASGDSVGSMQINGNTFSNVGSVTGARYSATANAVIQTFGAGASYLPGNAAGSVGSGGIYQ